MSDLYEGLGERMTNNPFDLFVDKSDWGHPVPTEMSDEDLSKLSDEELIERANAVSLTTAYIDVNGVIPLKNLFNVLLENIHNPYLETHDEDVIEWGPKEIAELGITVGQLKGLLNLIWKYGVCPCLESRRDLLRYLWEVLLPEAHKRGYWDSGAYDTTVTECRWTYFQKEAKE